MGMQKVTPPIKNPTWVKGILVIERCMGAELNQWGCKKQPHQSETQLGLRAFW